MEKMQKGKMMNNGSGVYSYKSNPLQPAKQVKPMCGPGSNPDMQRANKMLEQAQVRDESLRGKSGM